MRHPALGMTALALAACALAAPALAQVNLTTATASPGSVVHVTTHHLAAVAGERGIASLQVGDGLTLTNTVLDVAEGRMSMSEAPMILPFMLARGMGPYSGVTNGAELAGRLRALFPYNSGAYTLITLSSTGIESWEDLRGRTIFNGPPRGASLTSARQVMTMVTGMEDGTDYTGYQANWGQLNAMMTDGSVDAFIFPTLHPSERVILAQAAGDVNIVSVPREIFEGEEFQRLFQIPGNIPVVMPWADSGYDEHVHLMQSDDGMLRSMGAAFATVVRDDFDEQLAYDLVSAYIETLDQLRAATPYSRNAGHGVVDAVASGFCGANELRYHPGAVRAWTDHGYELPACALPG